MDTALMLLSDTGLPMPDYGGGSIVNLMASLIRAQGGAADYPNLRLLPPEAIQGHTNVLLLVIDGLGANWLAERSPTGILSRHQIGTITSVFPTTTASAITTFLTGDAPQQHGITGWFTYFRELGCVMSVLPGHPRYGGTGYRQAGVDLASLLGHRCLASRIQTRAFFLTPAKIAHSDFNLAHLGPAQARPFQDLRDMFRQAARLLRADTDPKYLYCYWPGLDGRGHEAGMASPLAARHLGAIEQALTDFMVASAGTDTLVLVTADHGLIDTAPPDRIDLADHPELAACLSLPLCGEPRAALCYLRPRRVQAFEDYCQNLLGGHALLRPSQDLIQQGLFGQGEPHPWLEERVGDYTLLMTGRSVIRDHLASEKSLVQIGVHGGLSDTELLVPLCRLRS
jgi:hypothetical protein